MERIKIIEDMETQMLKGDCAVVGAPAGIVEQLSIRIRQAYYNNNVYFVNNWEKLKNVIDSMHLDVIVIGRGYGSIITNIKSYCTIPVIHIYGDECPEDSFADIRVRFGRDTIEMNVFNAVEDLLRDGRDRIEFRGAVRCSGLKVDMDNYVTTYDDGEPVSLKPMETRLLFYLMKFRNRVVLKNLLAENVWEMPEAVYTRTIDVHIKNLRKRINECKIPVEILTVRRTGYRLTDKEMP